MRLKKSNKGITLIALVITIIVLLILAGVAIATLTGDNGVLTKAVSSKEKTDIAETKEQIKLEIMGNLSDEGKYTNADVVKAVKKITNKDGEEKAESVESLKGNIVDLSDLWVENDDSTNGKRYFTINGISCYFTDEESARMEDYEGTLSAMVWLREHLTGYSAEMVGGARHEVYIDGTSICMIDVTENVDEKSSFSFFFSDVLMEGHVYEMRYGWDGGSLVTDLAERIYY